MRFEVLGPLRVSREDGLPVRLVSGRQRALLTALILHANRTVPVQRLIAALWGDDAPPSARGLVSTYVWRVRGLLADRPGADPARRATTTGPAGGDRTADGGATRIVGEPRGYRLRVRPEELDVAEFSRLARQAQQTLGRGDAEQAARGLRAALALWRGEPAEDVRLFGGFEADLDQLAEMRAAALEARIAADLTCGRHQELVGELRGLTAAYPLRERFAAQLMLSLARCGRRAEALGTYHAVRGRIAEELGIDPGPELRTLYEAVLRGDPEPAGTERACCRHPASPPTGPAGVPAGGVRDPGPGPAAPPASAAPAPAPDHGPVCNLPPAIADFTGRAAELRAAQAAARPGARPNAPTILAVVGMGGVGKTTLARQVAGNVAAWYPDGQLFVDLRGMDDEPVSCPQALARLLGLLGVPAGQVPTEPDDQTDLFRTLVAHRRILLLLDNARDERQVRPLLATGARCLTIVTSRNLLTGLDAVRRIGLDRMPPAEATAMFRRVCGKPPARRHDAAALRQAVELCGGLPLAIRIAAARMAARPAWGLEELVARLRDGDRLAELATGDRSIDAVFDLSYRYLPPADRELFDRLALLPTTEFDPAAAAAALGDGDAAATRRRLERLVDLSLLQALPGGRYQRHDLLHLYALEHLRGRHRSLAEAARPVLDWYLSRTRHATALCARPSAVLPAPDAVVPPNPFTGTEQARAWLDAEHRNLAAAVTQALSHDLPEYAWRLADLLRPYYHRRRHMTDWLSVTQAALQAAVARHDVAAQAAMHLSLGLAHKCTGRHGQAVRHYRQAARLSRQAGWAQGRAAALGNLGVVLCCTGRLDLARTAYRTAAAIFERGGDLAGQARGLFNLATVDLYSDQLERAHDTYLRALAAYQRLDDADSVAFVHAQLAYLDQLAGRRRDAIRHARRAMAQAEQTGYYLGAITVRLADTLLEAGQIRPAEAAANAALATGRRTDDRETELKALNTLAQVALRRGDAEAARAGHQHVNAVAGDLGLVHLQIDALLGIAATYRPGSDLAAARAAATEVVELATRTHNALKVRQAGELLGRLDQQPGTGAGHLDWVAGNLRR